MAPRDMKFQLKVSPELSAAMARVRQDMRRTRRLFWLAIGLAAGAFFFVRGDLKR